MGEVTRSSDQKKIRTGFLIFFFPPPWPSPPLWIKRRGPGSIPWFLFSCFLPVLLLDYTPILLYSYTLILDSLYIRLRHTLSIRTISPYHLTTLPLFTFSPFFYFIHIEVTTYFYTFGHFSDTSRSTFLRELVPVSQHRHLVVLSVIPPLFKSWTVKSVSLS